MVEVLGFSGFGTAIFALISVIVSVAVDYWIYVDQNGVKSYAGLWNTCVDSVCASFPDAFNLDGSKILPIGKELSKLIISGARPISFRGLMIVVATEFIRLSPLIIVSAMDILESSQWLDALVSTELKAVRAMLILALLLIAGAIVCGGLKQFMMKTQKMLGYIAVGLLGAAGLFLMIGFSVYTAEIYDSIKSIYDLHAGFAFCVIAWIASWVAAALFGLVVSKEK